MQWQAKAPVQKKWIERFADQPHQLFFIAALFWAIFTMAGTFFSLIGKNIDFGLYHGFGLFFAVFTNAFFGFLFTVIPKYTNALPISERKYKLIFALFQVGVITAFLVDQLLGKVIVSLAMVLTSLIFFGVIKEGKFTHKHISKWLATLVMIGAFAVFADTMVAFWLYLVPLVFVIAQRMIPAFYDAWFNRPSVERDKLFVVPFIASFWLIAIGYASYQTLLISTGALAGFVLTTYFFLSLKPFRKTPAIVWVLALGVFWLAFGLFVLTIESFLQLHTAKLAFHIIAVGMLLTLLVGFGTRVILGHSNQKIEADRFAVGVFLFAQFVVLIRAIASLLVLGNSGAFIGMLHLSAWGWIVLFVVWGARHAKTLLRIKS